MRDITDGDDPYFAADVLNYARNFPRGTLVLGTDGCEVTSDGTDMTLDIASGKAAINDITEDLPTGTVTLDASDSFDRYDLVVVEEQNDDYVYASVTGTQEKVTPTLQPDQVLLAVVFVEENTSSIASGDVHDARILSTRTEDDGIFNTLQVLEAPTEDDDAARKYELDQKSDTGHDHSGETITPETVEFDQIDWTGDDFLVGDGVDSGSGSNRIALGTGTYVSGEGSMAFGHLADSSGLGSLASGAESEADGTGALAHGRHATADGAYSFAGGHHATADGSRALALGGDASATDDDTVAIGPDAEITGTASSERGTVLGPAASLSQGRDSLVAGSGAAASTRDAVSLGHGASVSGRHGVSIGHNSDVGATLGVSIGENATVLENGGLAFGPGATVETAGTAHINVDQLRFGAVEGTIPDAELDAQELTVEADEDNSEFKIRYKDSGGTIQTGSIQFD